MSNFSKDDLYHLYDKYLPVFIELASIAEERNISLQLDVNCLGTIEFISREVTIKKNKSVCKRHTIAQGKDFVHDDSHTTVIKD